MAPKGWQAIFRRAASPSAKTKRLARSTACREFAAELGVLTRVVPLSQIPAPDPSSYALPQACVTAYPPIGDDRRAIQHVPHSSQQNFSRKRLRQTFSSSSPLQSHLLRISADQQNLEFRILSPQPSRQRRARSLPAAPRRSAKVPRRRAAWQITAQLRRHSWRSILRIRQIAELHRSLPAQTLRLPPAGSSHVAVSGSSAHSGIAPCESSFCVLVAVHA